MLVAVKVKIMRTITIFEKGDVVKLNTDWRYWKKGDLATVVDTEFERGIGSNQLLILDAHHNKKAANDASCVYAYNCELSV